MLNDFFDDGQGVSNVSKILISRIRFTSFQSFHLFSFRRPSLSNFLPWLIDRSLEIVKVNF